MVSAATADVPPVRSTVKPLVVVRGDDAFCVIALAEFADAVNDIVPVEPLALNGSVKAIVVPLNVKAFTGCAVTEVVVVIAPALVILTVCVLPANVFSNIALPPLFKLIVPPP